MKGKFNQEKGLHEDLRQHPLGGGPDQGRRADARSRRQSDVYLGVSADIRLEAQPLHGWNVGLEKGLHPSFARGADGVSTDLQRITVVGGLETCTRS
jgi:hypothetical protein